MGCKPIFISVSPPRKRTPANNFPFWREKRKDETNKPQETHSWSALSKSREGVGEKKRWSWRPPQLSRISRKQRLIFLIISMNFTYCNYPSAPRTIECHSSVIPERDNTLDLDFFCFFIIIYFKDWKHIYQTHRLRKQMHGYQRERWGRG